MTTDSSIQVAPESTGPLVRTTTVTTYPADATTLGPDPTSAEQQVVAIASDDGRAVDLLGYQRDVLERLDRLTELLGELIAVTTAGLHPHGIHTKEI